MGTADAQHVASETVFRRDTRIEISKTAYVTASSNDQPAATHTWPACQSGGGLLERQSSCRNQRRSRRSKPRAGACERRQTRGSSRDGDGRRTYGEAPKPVRVYRVRLRS